MSFLNVFLFILLFDLSIAFLKDYKNLDICSFYNSRKLYVEYGTSGELLADYRNRMFDQSTKYDENSLQRKCTIELITCPSCVIDIKFKYLNISRSCGNSPISTQCACDYVFLHEPPFEDTSGEQFCGRFIKNNISELTYYSRTRLTTVDFLFSDDYGHAFTLQFSSRRNQVHFDGFPTTSCMNNESQIITSPFFPHLYPSDLTAEYVIQCHSKELCRISLIFTDFLMADSSILEFFDWNGQRMYVISGNIFRPPVVLTSGPTLVMRFYANGASSFGFKGTYSFVLGNADDTALKPNIDCGGDVNNLGGGITMMNMVSDGTTFFDCIWIVKTPTNFLHRKTHLYVKIVNFTNFAGSTELILRQGVISDDPAVELLRFPMRQFKSVKKTEHIVSIKEGFYISLRGFFKSDSQVTIVYAAFNYKDCFSGLDFLCHNLRCISALLNCDGFDHCGDNSDESPDCSQDPRDHRAFSKVPNFLFPKVEPYADLTTATFVFLLCTFGLIGIIFAMAMLLYRVNIRARHQRQVQDHIETIHAILEEGVSEIEEEIIIPDEPPDYEPPPEYSDVLKYIKRMACGNRQKHKSSPPSFKPSQSTPPCTSHSRKSISPPRSEASSSRVSTSRSCQTSPINVPESPPPAYENILGNVENVNFNFEADEIMTVENASCSFDIICSEGTTAGEIESTMPGRSVSNQKVTCFAKKVCNVNMRKGKSVILIKNSRKIFSSSDDILVRSFSDSDLIYKPAEGGIHSQNSKEISLSTNDIFCN